VITNTPSVTKTDLSYLYYTFAGVAKGFSYTTSDPSITSYPSDILNNDGTIALSHSAASSYTVEMGVTCISIPYTWTWDKLKPPTFSQLTKGFSFTPSYDISSQSSYFTITETTVSLCPQATVENGTYSVSVYFTTPLGRTSSINFSMNLWKVASASSTEVPTSTSTETPTST